MSEQNINQPNQELNDIEKRRLPINLNALIDIQVDQATASTAPVQQSKESLSEDALLGLHYDRFQKDREEEEESPRRELINRVVDYLGDFDVDAKNVDAQSATWYFEQLHYDKNEKLTATVRYMLEARIFGGGMPTDTWNKMLKADEYLHPTQFKQTYTKINMTPKGRKHIYADQKSPKELLGVKPERTLTGRRARGTDAFDKNELAQAMKNTVLDHAGIINAKAYVRPIGETNWSTVIDTTLWRQQNLGDPYNANEGRYAALSSPDQIRNSVDYANGVAEKEGKEKIDINDYDAVATYLRGALGSSIEQRNKLTAIMDELQMGLPTPIDSLNE